MALRLTVEERNGKTQVSVRYPNASDAEPFGDPKPFTLPLAIDDLEELRFYLEDYASLPIGEYAVRGEQVEKERLLAWGDALFNSVFGGDDKRRDAYCIAYDAASRNEAVEVSIRSNNPQFLALPWELMKAPGERVPFSVRVQAFDRALPITDPARQFPANGDGFRVLMVIARPEGIRDVPFQAVARPLFKHVESAGSAVQIEILRPPSFEAFKKRLQAAKDDGEPYHAVHFDGHGTFGVAANAGNGLSAHLFAGEAQGYVLFEKEAGGAEAVGAGDFAAALKDGGVPLVILNACKSGKIETADDAASPEASVATRLLLDGAASVVAMSYSVYVVAAAAFMAVFYEALFAGKSVSEAVNTGRKALRLEQNRLRPSLKGEMPLQDWMVPVHYSRSTLRLPVKQHPKFSMEAAARLFAEAKAEGDQRAGELAAVDGVFFGRDSEFFILERAIRGHVAVIHGVGGTGKTELAKAFARWLQISGGLDNPQFVFFHSFEPGQATFGLDSIVNEIMARICDAQAYLAAGTTRERAELVLQLFRQARCLLIWDNFETAASMPEPGQATQPLDPAKKAELLWFIGELQNSKSALLITSRSKEAWLGGPESIVRCEVGGLAERDALHYADHLMEPHAEAIARRAAEPKAFKELIDYLGGHPLSLRLILPRLTETSPTALLAGLRGQGPLPPGFEGAAGRLESLGASLYYSFRHLPEEDRKRLVILSLFEKVVSANILDTMEGALERFQGHDVEGWDALLTRLSGLGLLTGLGGGLYRLHPALPAYLGALWQTQAEDYAEEREAILRSLIAAAASFAEYRHQQINAGQAEVALTQIAALRASFGAFLAAALNRKLFVEARELIQALNEYWVVAGLVSEAAAWGDRTVRATEPRSGQLPEIESHAHDLWLFVIGAEAIRADRAGDLAKAESIYGRIVESFEGRKSDKARRNLAVAHYQFGMVAWHRGKLDEADDWTKKSLAIFETLGNQPGMASSYHQLGMVAQDRGHLDEAEGWYKKSLAIEEALDNQPGMASSYHQLGTVALDRSHLDEAEGWTKKSLVIEEVLSNQLGMASSYGQLGTVALYRGHLDEAEGWTKKALAIQESLGNQPGMALTYSKLGVVAQDRGHLDEAERWYKKALAIFQALDDQPNKAKVLEKLRILKGQQSGGGTKP